MTKAFVLEPSRNDVSAAEQFGEIVYLYPDGAKRVSIWHKDFIEGALEQLEKMRFNKHRDFFVIIGNMAPMIMMVGAMVSKYTFFDALLFDVHSRNYTIKTLGVNDLKF